MTDRGSEQGRKQPVEPDEDGPIRSAQSRPRWCGPLQDEKLLAEECHLGFASRPRPAQSNEQAAEQLQKVDHLGARVAHRCITVGLDRIFGSHTYSERSQAAPVGLLWAVTGGGAAVGG